jgi:diaminopimelate epimerase
MNRLCFTKMHGIGNDFVVLNGIEEPVNLSAEQIRYIADRRFGIGCDQVLLVEFSPIPEIDFRYRIFNADGTEVEQCGNGARCFARYVRDSGLTDKNEIVVETQAGIIRLYVQNDGQVKVNMGQPEFTPARIPFHAPAESLHYPLEAQGRQYSIGAVSMGNPHLILKVDSVEDAPLASLGPILEQHPRFPRRVNVSFMQVIDYKNIKLRVYERGTGETLACGTAACAAMAMARRWGYLDSTAVVTLPGGQLQITWEGGPVWMTGPATRVFEGIIWL